MVKDYFLDLCFRKETWEEVACPERVSSLVDILIATLKSLGISRHLLLEDQEVHDLMEHRDGIRALRETLHALLLQLVGCLFCVHFERLHAFAEHVDFFEDVRQFTLKGTLQDLQGGLLLQLALLEAVQGVKAEFE